jgi:hypothetical protein
MSFTYPASRPLIHSIRRVKGLALGLPFVTISCPFKCGLPFTSYALTAKAGQDHPKLVRLFVPLAAARNVEALHSFVVILLAFRPRINDRPSPLARLEMRLTLFRRILIQVIVTATG